MEDYQKLNKKLWDTRLDIHLDSDFYDLKTFINGKSSLNSIELDLLGDLNTKELLHLQCHFGQDSISLSKLGAQVTGVDFSEKSIQKARQLADLMKVNTQFICNDVYSLPQILDNKFDIVFTSYGVINWLPDLDQWAAVIKHFLKPGGKLVFVEFHPVVWMFDDDFYKVAYSYFNTGPLHEQETGSYADRSSKAKTEYINWNHSLDEVFSALLLKGFRIVDFREYDYSPYNCFKHTIEDEPGVFRIKHLGKSIPMVFSMVATI